MKNKKEILPDAIYTTEEAAELLELNVLTIQKYIREKKIEAMLIGGKWYRIQGFALLKFKDESKTYQIVPCSWRLTEIDKWIPRADIIHWMGDRVNVKNWEFKDKRLQCTSREAADLIATKLTRQKLLKDHGVDE